MWFTSHVRTVIISQILIYMTKDVIGQLNFLDEALQGLQNFDSILSKVGDADCNFKCKNGIKPRSRHGHRPQHNGCGSYGFKLDTSMLPRMDHCCNEHDVCYDTCNMKKATCDSQFKACLQRMCADLAGITKHLQNECKATVEIMYHGTGLLGCKSYLESQESACDCGDRKYNKRQEL